MEALRHQTNKNLKLYEESHFQGFMVQSENGPLVAGYLVRTMQVIESASRQYGRVFAFRMDLHLPNWMPASEYVGNAVLERFFASFKAKIRHNRNEAKEGNPYAHDTIVRYIWCREIGQRGLPHYHVAILLNHDAFCTLGKFELNRDNLFNRLIEAWASALVMSVEDASGLVHFPKNPFYLIARGDIGSLAEFFYRVSYLCKADSKQYGDGVHGFGASRG